MRYTTADVLKAIELLWTKEIPKAISERKFVRLAAAANKGLLLTGVLVGERLNSRLTVGDVRRMADTGMTEVKIKKEDLPS